MKKTRGRKSRVRVPLSRVVDLDLLQSGSESSILAHQLLDIKKNPKNQVLLIRQGMRKYCYMRKRTK
jgi:hypothetical protein